MRTTVRAFQGLSSQAPANHRIRLERGPESGHSEDQIHVPVSNSVRLQWGQESSPSQVKRQAIVKQRSPHIPEDVPGVTCPVARVMPPSQILYLWSNVVSLQDDHLPHPVLGHTSTVSRVNPPSRPCTCGYTSTVSTVMPIPRTITWSHNP